MATLKNCVRCGKMFNAEGAEELCSDCVVEESKELRKVTEFLKKNPMASVMNVHEQTGISQQAIFRFVRNGSLKMRAQAHEFKCRLCGKNIKRGILCDDCRNKVESMQKKKK